MQQFADAAAGQVRVMGLISKDGRPQAESFAADAGVTFPSAFDGDGELMTELGLNALPYTYFLDADGAPGLHAGRPGRLGRRAARAGRRAPGRAAVTLPDYLKRLIDAADDLPLRHRMPQATATARRSAVLILFGEGPQGPDVLLIEKSAHLRSHAGQPAFPGGGVDPGDDFPIGTALREAEEEAGIDPAGVRVLATLQELFLPPSNRLVVPVVGVVGRPARRHGRRSARGGAGRAGPAGRPHRPGQPLPAAPPLGLHRPGVLRRRHGGVGLHRRPARRDPRGRRPGPAVGHDRRAAAAAVGASGRTRSRDRATTTTATTPRRRSPIPRPTALRHVPFPRDEEDSHGGRLQRWSCCSSAAGRLRRRRLPGHGRRADDRRGGRQGDGRARRRPGDHPADPGRLRLHARPLHRGPRARCA